MNASPFRNRIGLRLRFALALWFVVTVIAAGFVYAVHVVVDRLEYELLDYRLENELQEFADAYRFDPQTPLLAWGGLRRYAALHGEGNAIPQPLRSIEAGEIVRTAVEGREVVAARRDVGDVRLLTTIDVAPVEALEGEILRLMWIVLALGYALALLAALMLAALVTRPVEALARRVAALEPGTHEVRLSRDFQGPEVGAIAAAFDQFLHRLRAFVAREQAFTEDASHELRTPVSTIRSTTELLREDESLPDSACRRLERIHRATVQMEAQIDALLFLAREEHPGNEDPCDLATIVRGTAEACAESPEAQRSTIALGRVDEYALRAPAAITTCVVQNLILNAVMHTTRGRIDVELIGGVLRVRDTGAGVPTQDLERIFERGYRGRDSRGTGLGLYLVKRICDRFGWRIQLQTAPDVGTCFEVSFQPP